MINISPALTEESQEERNRRQRATGVFGNGHTVECHPTGDPEVREQKHRVVCLLKPYAACQCCPHSKFKLFFDANPKANLQIVKCPRWRDEEARARGERPSYTDTEILTCASKPFPACQGCPSKEDLSTMYIDKTKDGWYMRFKRFSEEEGHDRADSR